MKNSYNIGIKNGLIDTKHFESLGIAIWLYLWIIDHQTRNSDKVLSGKPVTYEMVANDYTTLSRRTFERWLNIIKAGGYISTMRTPYGHIITICKPKKWQDNTTDMPNMAHLKRQKRHISPPNMAHLSAKNGTSNKDITLDNTLDIIPPPPPPHEKITSMFDYWKTTIGIEQNRTNKANTQACERLLTRFSEKEIKQLVAIADKAHQDRYAPKIVKAADYFQLDRYSDDILIWAKSKVLTKERITKI